LKHIFFVDFVRAFAAVAQKEMWENMAEKKFPIHLTRTILSMNPNETIIVRKDRINDNTHIEINKEI
jgi:hypothetical protein